MKKINTKVAILTLLLCSAFAVFNGIEVTQGQFPYLVYVMVNPGQSDTYACGGGIISKRYVMTAGHCSFGSVFQVITGRIDVQGYYSTDLVDVNRVIRPSDFGSLGFDYDDIAIFELAKDVSEVPNYIQYLDIGLNAPPVGQPLTLVGFGQLANGENTPKAHYGTTYVSPDDECHFDSYQPSVSFCTADPNLYSCPGDSGTPIVVKPAGAVRWVSVGIDSYGHEGTCGDKEYDSIVAKVASMIDFIRDNTLLAPPNFVNLTFASNGAVTGSTAAPQAGHQDSHPTDCWTCPPGYSHWWDAGYSSFSDPCGCVPGVFSSTTSNPTSSTTTTSSPSTTTLSPVAHRTDCWTCPPGFIHWWDAGETSSNDPCGCVAESKGTVPTSTTLSPVAHRTDCWTCPPGFIHWWDAGETSNNDPCGCVPQ